MVYHLIMKSMRFCLHNFSKERKKNNNKIGEGSRFWCEEERRGVNYSLGNELN